MNKTSPFNRMPRIQEALPQGEVKIPAPPNVSPLSKQSWFQTLLPLLGMFVMVGIYGGMYGNPTMAIAMAAMSGFSVLGSIVGKQMQRKNHKKEVAEKEAAYAEALKQKQTELEDLRQKQQHIRADTDPDLATLLGRAQNRDPRLWERRPEDADFLNVRLGIGDLPSTVIVSAPHPDMPDPHLKEAHAIEAEYARVPQVPVLADVRMGPLGIAGPLSERNGIARAMICNLVVHHSPDEVHLLAVYSPHRTLEWQWLKWLPHTYALNDETGRHYLANDSLSAGDVLKDLLDELHRRQNRLYAAQQEQDAPAWPWLVLFVEDYSLVRNDPAIRLLLSPQSRQLNVTALFAVNQPSQVPTGCSSVVESQPDGQLRYSIAGAAGDTFSCWPEYADVALSEQLARSLAPVEVYTLQSDSDMPSNVRLLDMLGIKDINRYNVASNWNDRSPAQYLKVPIGERRGNQPMVLDLSHTGHGPHGLIAGTTGSGKSELVQTLVVGLALTHHPYDVGFVLVDFKGGGTFSDLVRLPHTLGMVTDLSGNLTERALVALDAEMDRRKRLFNAAGVNDIGSYQDLYWQHKVKKPLPRLVVIVDEFAELVTDYPDFMDGLIGIARVGRSLGVHLILATQSPAGVVKQQIWANAKFRICLRVESRQESQEMLHRQEAANLPRVPGRGYLQVGNNDVFELFQVARVAGRYNITGDTGALQLEKRIVISEVSPLGQRNTLFDSHKARQSQAKTAGLTDIDAVVPRLVDEAQKMGLKQLPSPWPDPLPEHVALPELLLQKKYAGWNGNGWVFDRAALTSPVVPARFCRICGAPLRAGAKFCPDCGTPVRNRCSQCGSLLKPRAKFCPTCGTPVQNRCQQCGGWLKPGAKFCPACGSAVTVVAAPTPTTPLSPRPPSLPNRTWLGATMGLLDDPAHQRQFPMLLQLDQQDGQLIVIGASGSGKEMWVRTLITSLARTHTPDELYFYLLEFSGQALEIFRKLPHVGGIFTPLDNERVKRLLRLLLDSLEERKQQCNQARVDGLVRLREMQPEQAPPAIVVVITGFVEFRNMFQDELFQLIRLIREGGPYGIHIVLLGNRAGDIPPKISSVVARRVVLRLAEADEYSLVLGDRLKPSKEQKFPPGRGWYGHPPLEFQTATPGYEEAENAQLTELEQIVDKMNAAWQGVRPEPVKKLPDEVLLDGVLSRVSAPSPLPRRPQLTVPLGLDSVRMKPVLVDLVDDGPNFIVAGTSRGGKTTLLWTWALSLAEFNSPQQVQFVLLSGRRDSLRSLKELPHILSYCRTPEDFCQNGILERLQAEIQRRETLLSDNFANAGGLPHIVVLFDDYDEFFNAVGEQQEVKDGLTILAKHGRDVNIHTVVAGPLPKMGVGYNDSLVKQLKIGRSGFILKILDASGENPLGIRIRALDIKQLPAGRGYLVRNGSEEMLQVATPGDSTAVAAWVDKLKQRWNAAGCGPAGWPEADTDLERNATARV